MHWYNSILWWSWVQRPTAKLFAQVIDVFHNLCLSEFPSFLAYEVYSIPVHIPWTLFQETAPTSLPIWSFYSRQNGLDWPLYPVITISHPKPLKKKKKKKGLKVTKRKSEWESLINLEDRWVKPWRNKTLISDNTAFLILRNLYWHNLVNQLYFNKKMF